MLCNFSTDWILLQVVCVKHRQHINYEGNLKQQTNMCRKLFLFITNLFWYLFKLATLLATYLYILKHRQHLARCQFRKCKKTNCLCNLSHPAFHISCSLLSCYFGNLLSYWTEKYTWYNNLLSNQYFINYAFTNLKIQCKFLNKDIFLQGHFFLKQGQHLFLNKDKKK